MLKYAHIFHVGLQNALAYRANFFFRAVFGLLPLTATLALWQAIFRSNPDRETVAGYTLGEMMAYYLLMTVVDALTAVTEDDWQIAADIREGRLSPLLLKPLDYLAYRLSLFAAGRVVYAAAALLPVGLFVLLHHQHGPGLPADPLQLLAFGLALLLTALLQFLISFTTALLAFWLLEISTWVFILFAFEYLAGGHLFPLDILPAGVQAVLQFTPFPYQLFFPVGVGLGRIEGPALVQGLTLQLFWVGVFYGLARWVWARGLRHYTAAGG